MCTENLVITALGAKISFTGEMLEYPPANFIQYFLVHLPWLMQPLVSNTALLDWNGQERDDFDAVC